ncbi:hypothetical protein COT72_02605 [archaeon CG10_big_fil_rev_8_21_14_0_10_43_11]|nr:MAG: hypothetical protein COT72_02605 [archaeon CG10_big_fil_rev_8_21_14_0_10_43_11]
MKRAQAEILGTVLISAILLVVVGGAFVWGKPLIDKSGDKSKFDTILLKFDEIDAAIKNVGSTGSSRVVKLNLRGGEQFEITNNGELRMQIPMKVPLITSRDYTPLNSFELPEERQLYFLNLNETLDRNAYPNLIAGGSVPGSTIYNTSLGEGNWNALVYRTISENYDYLCIALGSSFDNPSQTAQCGKPGESIETDGGDYSVIRINNSGDIAYLAGDLIENTGLITRDVPGIIMAKSTVLGETQGLITDIKMQYRGLSDDQGIIHRITISCVTNCIAGEGARDVRILRTDVQRNPNSIDTYINVEFV